MEVSPKMISLFPILADVLFSKPAMHGQMQLKTEHPTQENDNKECHITYH